MLLASDPLSRLFPPDSGCPLRELTALLGGHRFGSYFPALLAAQMAKRNSGGIPIIWLGV